jgi:hypothetical protein
MKADIGPTLDLAAIVEKAAALDLLEQWLDVHPGRAIRYAFKQDGRLHIALQSESPDGRHISGTQETLASAIRTVLQVAYANGDR